MWTMPEWMKPYSNLISPQGEAHVVEMVNDKTPIQINAPRALIATEIVGRVQMITRLNEAGLLGHYDPDRIC